MRYSCSDPKYNEPFADKCWELWHAGFPQGPHCTFKELGHDGPHEGRGLQWHRECLADAEVARRFWACYMAIPNNKHEIWLNDDGTVGMTLRGFEDATRFIGVSMNNGD